MIGPRTWRFSVDRCKALLRRLREESGNALVETAVVLSLVGVPLFLGTIYFGVLLCNSIEITNAAHTGALYAMRSSTFAEDTAGITAAAQADASHLGTNLTVTATVYYTCSDSEDGTQYATPAAANAVCSASTHTLEFVQVVASAPITPPTTMPGMPRTMTLSSTSAMEVEE